MVNPGPQKTAQKVKRVHCLFQPSLDRNLSLLDHQNMPKPKQHCLNFRKSFFSKTANPTIYPQPM